MMEGGDTGGYSHGVLKSMTNDECRSLFGFVFIPGQSLSSVGALFPYTGSRFRMWAVIFICGRLSCGGGSGGLPWPVLVFGCHVTVSDVAPGFPVSKESGGRGVFTHLGWVDVPHRRCCVVSIWPALVHLVPWRCRVVLVVLGHSVVGWSTRVHRLGLSVLVVVAVSDMALPHCRWLFLLWIAVGGGRCWWQ